MKLKTRLLLILLAVILTGSLFTFTFLRFTAQGLLRAYVFSGDREKARLYASLLSEYYLERKSWDGVQSFLTDVPRLAFQEMETRIHGDRPGYRFFSPEVLRSLITERVVLADEGGIIVADTAKILLGTRHPLRHLAGGTPVMADSRKAGVVLVGSMIDSSLTDSAEAFLTAMNRAFTAATLLSGFLAFLLGLVFTLRITRTLGALSEGARRIGAGDLRVRITAQGRDEIAELAASFNHMAEELQKLEQAKRQIIADSAHELRTPLTLIQGIVEGMMDGVLPVDAATLQSVHEESRRLSRLVDTLRELELIESGKIELRVEPVNPAELVRKAAFPFAKTAEEKGITLSILIPDSDLPPIFGDYLRLVEVLHNLLTNALRYTPRGGEIRITVHGSGGTKLILTVEDSGPGIPEGERERIFERFYRLDKSRSSEEGGRGLGLSIAREIVRAHGGTISVGVSNLGGAEFRVELPVGVQGLNTAEK